MLTSHIIRVAVEAALAEDAPYGDITATTIPGRTKPARPTSPRENGVTSGIDVRRAQYPDKTVFCLDPVVCPDVLYPPGLPLGLWRNLSWQRGQSHHRGRKTPPAVPGKGGTGAALRVHL